MPFFRLSILFAFFAFSFARAACPDKNDFEIFAKTATEEKSLGCDDEVSTDGKIDSLMYGDTLMLYVSPPDTTYIWTTNSGTIIKTGSSFSPKFLISKNPKEDVIETYKVLKDSLTKTIEVIISPRTTYTVSFDTDDDDYNTEIDDQEVMKDSLAKDPKVTLTKEGYNFGGWYFDFDSTHITKDTTIKAKWNIKAYLVSFDTDGGTPSVRSQVVAENDFAKEPKETLTRKGYEFDGWNFKFDTPITKDTIIKAKWKISTLFVGDTIVFDSSGYDLDTKLSREHRHYFVASPSRCEIKEKYSIKITIMTKDPDMVLQIKNEGQRPKDGKGSRYEIPFIFGKLGNLDSNTLIYKWVKKDGSPIKDSISDTIIIQTPVPFKDPLIKKKWNSIWFVNNNPKTNGLNDSITEFKWFKNNSEVGDSQYYSATSSNPNDVYNIVMQTSKGNRLSTKISTCQDTEDKENNEQTPKKRLAIKVLGVNEKSLNKDLKVYNLNGKLTKETPAGVYIVKE